MLFIHQYPDWTHFRYDLHAVMQELAKVRALQGRFSGKVNFALGEEKSKKYRLSDWKALFAIDGIQGDIRSFVSDMLTDFKATLGIRELCLLHGALGYSGYLRENSLEGITFFDKRGEKVVFSGVSPNRIQAELSLLLDFFNTTDSDPVLSAAIVHFWFLTIRPFQSGNGCIARVLSDLLLSRSEGAAYRFYSIFERILENRSEYFSVLEKTWLGNGDITKWLLWYFEQLNSALRLAEKEWDSELQEAKHRLFFGELSLSERELALLEYMRTEKKEISSSEWAEKKEISHDSALRDFKALIEKGILEKMPQSRGRNTKYRMKSILSN